MEKTKKPITKQRVFAGIRKYGILLFANLILALGTVLFYSPLNIVAGGLTGIGIIGQGIAGLFTDFPVLDIILYVGEALLIVLSFIFLGKKTTFKSLFSCIVYPVLTTILLRVIKVETFTNILYGQLNDLGQYVVSTETVDPALFILAGILGGTLTGIAVGLSFMVGGSTGGIDTVVLIIKKYNKKLKESTLCFLVDSLIILGGIALTVFTTTTWHSSHIILIFTNILGALLCSGVVEIIQSKRNESVIVTIISSKWKDINKYIISSLDRGSTLYSVVGGFTGEEKREIKAVVSSREYARFMEEIQKIDEYAFVTSTVARITTGRGFSSEKIDLKVENIEDLQGNHDSKEV